MLLVCHFILGDSRQRVFSKHRGRRQICFKEIVTPHKTRYHCLGFSGRTNEKKNCVEEKLDGLLPIFQFWVTIKHVVSRQAGRDTAWLACWGTQQSAATRAVARDTAWPGRKGERQRAGARRPSHSGVAIRFLYRDRERRARCDTAPRRYDMAPRRCDTAQCVRSLGFGRAHCANDPVLTQYTV